MIFSLWPKNYSLCTIYNIHPYPIPQPTVSGEDRKQKRGELNSPLS